MAIKVSVVFFDSGVGGLPYLERTRALLPNIRMHYVADDAGFPYGTKTQVQIIDLLMERFRRLRSRMMPQAVVIACNTASQAGLAALRKAHPDIPIIGTVPAIKPAAASTVSGKIAVMATERTVVDPYIDDLIARYASDAKVLKLPAQSLVQFVEHDFLISSREDRLAVIGPYADILIHEGVDRVVLACTHFLHIEADILDCLASRGAGHIKIVDSRQGIAHRLVQLVEEGSLPYPERGEKDRGQFFLTGDPPFDSRYETWADRFNLEPPARL
jgi:glutamate racemase